MRIVAATHQDLEALIQAGRFREDLYYRLNVICLETPPLRQRRDDILDLAVLFLNLQAERTGKLLTHIEPDAVEVLLSHGWPGNIRELENVIERASVLADGPSLSLEDLPPELRQPSRRRYRMRLPVAVGSRRLAESSSSTSASRALPSPTESNVRPQSPRAEEKANEEWNSEFVGYERQRLLDVLEEAGGNKSVAARLLGMPRSTFFSKLRKHGIA